MYSNPKNQEEKEYNKKYSKIMVIHWAHWIEGSQKIHDKEREDLGWKEFAKWVKEWQREVEEYTT